MPADSNIFQTYLQAPKSVMDYQAQYDQADARKNALALSAMDLSEKTQANTRAQKVRNALEALGSSATDEARINALKATATPEGFAQADALDKSIQERLKTKAVTGKDNAETESKKLEATIKAHDFHVQQLGSVNDPEGAKAWAVEGLKAGIFTPEQFARGFTNIPTDPAGFARWKQQAMQGGMSATEQLKMAQAKLLADQSNATTIRGQDVSASTQRRGQDMTSSTAAAGRAQADRHFGQTMAKDYAVAGVDPNSPGGVDANSERTAQAIASGQLPAPTGMALLNPKNQRILGRVMEINPQYDATTVSAKKAAATAFTTGKEGAMMRSLQVASQHLDQLGQLADAMDNGNLQLVNKIANTYSQQTGSPAVTNFEAAKEIVSKEVVKSIVAGGGGVSEREEAARIMANVKSPAQLKGAITQMRNLMGAQHEALLQQRRAAGLPDSTLPNYTEGASAAPAPGGMPSTSAIDAELARRAGKK